MKFAISSQLNGAHLTADAAKWIHSMCFQQPPSAAAIAVTTAKFTAASTRCTFASVKTNVWAMCFLSYEKALRCLYTQKMPHWKFTTSQIRVAFLWWKLASCDRVALPAHFFFFFCVRRPCHQILSPSDTANPFVRRRSTAVPQSLVTRSTLFGHVWWRFSAYKRQAWRMWSGALSACPHSHRDVSETPILFRCVPAH